MASTWRDHIADLGERITAVETTLNHRGAMMDNMARQVGEMHDYIVEHKGALQERQKGVTLRRALLPVTASFLGSVLTAFVTVYGYLHRSLP